MDNISQINENRKSVFKRLMINSDELIGKIRKSLPVGFDSINRFE